MRVYQMNLHINQGKAPREPTGRLCLKLSNQESQPNPEDAEGDRMLNLD